MAIVIVLVAAPNVFDGEPSPVDTLAFTKTAAAELGGWSTGLPDAPVTIREFGDFQ